jgi:hypothetical protein
LENGGSVSDMYRLAAIEIDNLPPLIKKIK